MWNKDLIKIIYPVAFALFLWMGEAGGWWDDFLGRRNPMTDDVSQNNALEMVIQKSHLVGWDGFEKVWEVTAERIWQEGNGNIINFENISEGIIFAEDGKTVKFRASRARWEKTRKELFAVGTIEVEVDDLLLTTQWMTVEYKTETLLCPKDITATGDGRTMVAGSGKLQMQEEVLSLSDGVEFIDKGNRLSSKGLLYHYETNDFELIEPKGVTLKL